MVKALRKKFVLVTTLMMITLFGILWTANRINLEYWADQDILSIIEILTDSGLFSKDSVIDDEMIIQGLTYEEPIIGIVLDEDSNILSKQLVGKNSLDASISDKTIKKMERSNGYKADGYIFTKRVLSNNELLIVAVNCGSGRDSIKRISINIILVILGIVFLILISFYLSRYVTLPAKEALEREKRFISDASHELKTPLSAISVNAQALELKGSDSIHIRNILSETGRMSRLIERLLTLSRLEENELVESKEFSLSDIAQEMLLTYEGIAYEKNRRLTYGIEENINMYGNEDEIRQLSAILIDNAIKNSNDNGMVYFGCYKETENIFFDVKNSGKGIRSEELDHIFERFYTTDKSRNGGSFGLGLAIAKEITQRHKGTISIKSEPDKETVFSVRFTVHGS